MFDSCSDAAIHPGPAPSPHTASMAGLRPRAVRRAIEYIHANLADSVRLEDIAGAVGLSVFHFSRTFRDTTGLAPHRYLTGARIERVKALLLDSGLSLAAIASNTALARRRPSAML